jgi:TrmH family RNA methyltransferase
MLEHCRVVLVGAMFGGNVGASARAVKNTDLGGLHLVSPTYQDDVEALKFSHNAEEVLAGAPRHDTLVEAIGDCTRVVGFTARQRHRRSFVALRDFARDWISSALENGPVPTALLFGRERDGLSNEELDHCTDLAWIPSSPQHPSYNLSQAVLLAGYELLAARLELDPGAPRLRPRRTKRPSPAPMADARELDELFAHLRAAFLSIGYVHPHTAEAMVRSWHEIFARAGLHRREAAMIRGLAQQILWSAQYLPEEVRPADSSQERRSG